MSADNHQSVNHYTTTVARVNDSQLPRAQRYGLSSKTRRTGSCRAAYLFMTWWRHQMETFSALLAICAGNSPVPGDFPTQRPVTRSFEVFFDLRLNKRLSKQSWCWWFETLCSPLWRHRNEFYKAKTTPLLVLPGLVSIYRRSFHVWRFFIISIRWTWDRLISIMRIDISILRRPHWFSYIMAN